jgi:hypothetical protein
MYMQPNTLVEMCGRTGRLKRGMEACPWPQSPGTYTFLRRKSGLAHSTNCRIEWRS